MSESARLIVDGDVEHPAVFSREHLSAMPEADRVRDVSRFPSGKKGDGVTLEALLNRVGLLPSSRYLTLHATKDDFHVCVPIDAVRAEAVVVDSLDGRPLPVEKGGPFRFLLKDPASCRLADLDDCANVKFLDRIEISAEPRPDTRPIDDDAHAALHAAEGRPSTHP